MAAPAILKIDILTDASKVQREVDKIEGTGGRLKSWAKGVGGAIAGAFAIDFAKDAITSASNFNETVSKTRQIFGQGAPAIERWSQDAATKLRMPQQAALESAASFQNMFTQLGVGGDQATKMSTGMLTMAADLASFNNVAGGTTEVTDMIAAAMRGEYDSLQRVVPSINAAAVEQKALEMTGKGATSELTAAEKAAATYQLILDTMGPAAGDAARTQDDLAGKTQIAKAKFEDTKVALGQALLPAMQAVTSFLNDYLIPAFKWLAEHDLVLPIIGFATAVWALNAALAANPIVLIVLAVAAFIAVIAALWIKWDEVWTWMMEHKALTAIILLLNPFVLWILAIVAAAKFLWANWDAIWNGIKKVTDEVCDAVQGIWDGLVSAFHTIVSQISSDIGSIVNVFNTVKDAATAVYNWVKDKFQAMADFIGGLVSGIVDTGERISNAIKGPINAVIRGWNNLEFKVPEVDLGPFGKIGGQTIGFPNIPTLATGGAVLRTGLAVVHRGEQFSGVGKTFGGQTTININVTTSGLGADAPQIQRAVANALRQYAQRNGPLDIPVRQAS